MAQLKNPSLTVKILDVDASPSRSPSTPVPRTPKVVGRLDNKWRELEREWNSKNGEQLGRLDISGKDGLLGRWKRRYDPDSGEQSSQDMLAILDKILNGVELVGAFAAQGVSTVFAPAGMCFNAVGFLLDIPKQIKEVYDALQDLFEEVNQFLIRFRIYKRLDDKVGLPDELVDSTTDLLITFIKICGVAGRLLRGGFRNRVRLGFKVLLRDDEMKGHLEAFRTLVDHSMMLNGTVMLEEVMNNSEATKQILSVTSEMNAEVKLLVARSNNEKTKQVNKDRLDRICRKLFERPPSDEMLVALPQEDMLPDTLDTLQATKEHQQWLEDSTNPRSVLVLWGPPGCGKSRMLEAVRAHLEIQRDEAGKDQANTYTAFFDFNDTRFKAARGLKEKSAASFISDALRSIAYQVASQSTTYTTDLVVRLSDSKAAKISKENDIETLLSLLGLARLSTAATSTLYVLLDGIEEQGAEGQKLLRALLDSEVSSAPGSLRIKILLTRTSDPESDPKISFALPLNTITKSLVAAFALEEMKRLDILQHKHKETRIVRRDVLEKLGTYPEHFTFDIVKARLAMLKKAIDDEAPKKKMDTILDTQVNLDSAREGQALLERLERDLGQKSKSINLLNKLLIWLLHSCEEYWSVEELEAALYLDTADIPIEPLAVKISRSYHQAIIPWGSWFTLNPPLREVLQDNTDSGAKNTPANEQRLISLSISVTDADEPTIKQFVWDLNEYISAGKFDFSKTLGQGDINRIGVDALQGHLTITRLCFKLMNEGWDKQTDALLFYAYTHFPYHLAELQKMVSKISERDKKMIGEGLVAFLRDPYEFEQTHRDHGEGAWMDDDDLVAGVRFWLTEPQTKAQLPLKERRWIDGVLSPSQGRLGFLRDLAIAIGKQWLTDARSPSYALYSWLDRFIEKNTSFSSETNASEEATGSTQEIQPSDTTGEAAPTSEHPDVTSGANSEAGTEKRNGVGEADNAPKGEATESGADPQSDGQIQSNETAPGPETTSEPNDIERIERALTWILDHAKISETDAYNVALGDTYSGAVQYNKGIEHHKRVPNESNERHYALLGLGTCYIGLGDQDNAYQCVKDCFKIFRGRADQNTLDTRDMSVYSTYLEYFGGCFEDSGNRERALEFLGEAYRLKPEAHEMFWRLMRLHCETSESQDEALHLLQDWYAKTGGTDPASSLLEMAEKSEQQNYLLSMFREMKNEKLRDSCNTMIEEALRIAGENSESTASARLFYLQGVIHALNADSDLRSKASTCWSKVLRVPLLGETEDDWMVSDIVNKAMTNLVRSAFDDMRARLPATAALPEAQKRALQREMQDTFDHTIRECAVPIARGANTVEKYMISMNSLLGFSEDARQKCMDEMGFALEILSDADPDNDKDGLDTLARVLCACGDQIGTFSAMSLLDREITRDRFLSDRHPESPAPSWDVRDKLKTGWCHYCDGCGKDVFSADVDGMWWCRFCPNFDLCTDCKNKHGAGTLRLELCSPSHVDSFIHMHHSGYTEDDLQDGKIKIDWEYVDDGNGGFTRKGGRIVNLEDWVEELRLKWNLPKPQGDGSRAQK